MKLSSRFFSILLCTAALASLGSVAFSEGDVSVSTLFYSKPEYRPVLEEWKKLGQGAGAIALFTATDPNSIGSESGFIGNLIALRADPQFWTADQIRDLSQFILLKAKQYKISPLLIVSLIEVESRFQPSALSPKGAMGLMQVMPATAAFLASNDQNLEWSGPEDLNDPKVNIEYGLRYVTKLKAIFQTPEHVITAYNIGPAALAKKLKNGEEISLDYYQKVMEAMQKYRVATKDHAVGNRGEWPGATAFAKRAAPATSRTTTMSDRVINPSPSRKRFASSRKIPWL